jgi:hypothetical protein
LGARETTKMPPARAASLNQINATRNLSKAKFTKASREILEGIRIEWSHVPTKSPASRLSGAGSTSIHRWILRFMLLRFMLAPSSPGVRSFAVGERR